VVAGDAAPAYQVRLEALAVSALILTPEIEQQIVDAIKARPDAPLILPDHAYDPKGRVVVLVDGLPIDLHRHLYNIIIRPIGYHERMTNASVVGNVNPHLFTVRQDRKSARTHCNKGHEYAGNEAPPNSRGYRCLRCLRESRPSTGGTPNGLKTHCPRNHEYDDQNTIKGKDGRRRCRVCKNARSAAYMANRRKETL
jgi:hypothetical protein